jgi:hypothetical protein
MATTGNTKHSIRVQLTSEEYDRLRHRAVDDHTTVGALVSRGIELVLADDHDAPDAVEPQGIHKALETARSFGKSATASAVIRERLDDGEGPHVSAKIIWPPTVKTLPGKTAGSSTLTGTAELVSPEDVGHDHLARIATGLGVDPARLAQEVALRSGPTREELAANVVVDPFEEFGWDEEDDS